MNYLKKIFLVFVFWCLSFVNMAQDTKKIAITDKDYNNNQIEMADSFRSDGKIYVVVAVVSVILIGIFGYLVVLERKIKNLEKMTDQQNK